MTESTRMRPVTIRMPVELIQALNHAAIDDGRVSASDMARELLYAELKRRGYLDGGT